MHIAAPALALLALLATDAAFAHQEAPEAAPNDAAEQQQTDDSAHGYQNPTGVDPDPRMDDHPAPEHDHEEEFND